MTRSMKKTGCLLFDWGDTLMRVFPEFEGPMSGWPRVEAVPHAREVLEELSPGYITALATNAADSREKDIRSALGRVGLGDLLDRIYCFRGVGHSKPSSGFFEAIVGDLGLKPSQVVMIGDDFETDVLGANRRGLGAVWFNERTGETREGGACLTIHDLRELPDALKRLGQMRCATRHEGP